MLDLKIDVRSLDTDDAYALADFLKSDEIEIRYHMFIQESAHAPQHLLDIIIKYAPHIGTAMFGGTMAALREKIKQWLLSKKKCEHRKIPIYGPDGQVVSVVECQLKHPEN
jgi:hypothetical protein